MPRLERTLARWRHRLMRRRPVRDVVLALDGAGPRYLIALPAEPDRVLDELPSRRPPAGTQTDDLRMPYWATPWASGVALARAIWQHAAALAGRRVAELGCGLGVTATAAADAGARLLAIDCFGEALAYCRYNVARNTARVPCTRLVDWRLPAGRATLAAEGPFDLLLAADVLYEAEDIVPLLELVPRLLPAGGELWLAEPGRATSRRFVAAARQAGWHASTQVMAAAWPDAGVDEVQVFLHRYRFDPAGRPGAIRAVTAPARDGAGRSSSTPAFPLRARNGYGAGAGSSARLST